VPVGRDHSLVTLATGDGRPDLVLTSGGNRPESHFHVYPQIAAGTLGAQVTYAAYDIPEALLLTCSPTSTWTWPWTSRSATAATPRSPPTSNAPTGASAPSSATRCRA
jgi:hypothetical protein